MDYIAILKQAAQITWRNKALWLFGILLALFGGGSRGGGSFGNTGNWQGNTGDFANQGNFSFPSIEPGMIFAIIAAVLIFFFTLMLIGIVMRSVTRASLIGMVGQIADDTPTGIKDGWRIGWSVKAWRIFGVNVLIGVPVFIFAMLTFLIALAPLLLLLVDDSLLPLAIIFTVLFVLGWIFVMLIVAVVVSPITELSWRTAVFVEKGVFSAIKQSIALIRGALKDIVLMLLILFGVGIAWGIVSFIFVLILLALGVIGGGIPALIGYSLTQEPIAAVLAGAPIFLAILIIPMIFIEGIYLTFHSAVWTLFYRELVTPKADVVSTAEVPTLPAEDVSPPLVIFDEPESPIENEASDDEPLTEI